MTHPTDDELEAMEVATTKPASKRQFRFSGCIMDKDMLRTLIADFDGDVDMHGITFSDCKRGPNT
jgi:hypothetical protein